MYLTPRQGAWRGGESAAASNEEEACASWIHPLPEGKPTCLTSSPAKEGVVLWELSNFWVETRLLWSILAKNVSARKGLLPCSVFGWAVTVDKDNPGKVLTAKSSHWGKNLLCRGLGIVYRGWQKNLILETYNVVSDHWTCWACSAPWQMLIFTKQIWSVIFSIDLNMF